LSYRNKAKIEINFEETENSSKEQSFKKMIFESDFYSSFGITIPYSSSIK